MHHNTIYAIIGTGIVLIVLSIVFRKAIAQFGIVKKILGFLKGFNEGLLSVFKIGTGFWLQSIGIWLGFFLINY